MRAIKERSHGGEVTLAALMPHAPVLVPEVGREQSRIAGATVAAMQRLARRITTKCPDGIIVISPHSPRKHDAFGIWSGPRLEGSFDSFGVSGTRLALQNDLVFKAALSEQMQREHLHAWDIPQDTGLDHGAMVPLWFLARAGWNGSTLVLGLNYPDEIGIAQLGSLISRVARQLGRSVAVIASGDMSHRLKPDAPAGYHPQAREFDREFITLLASGEYHGLEQLDARKRELAGEDVVDSTLIAAAAIHWNASGHEVLSYEGPFGVGYGVAVLFDAPETSSPPVRLDAAAADSLHWTNVLPFVAREAVEASLFETAEALPSPAQDLSRPAQGVFVTIHHSNGELRGCVGTLRPVCENIVEQTRQMARAAAFGDTRFSPVTREEFPDLRFKVNVVENIETVGSPLELDPDRYGVVVSTSDGRSGCLLPSLPTVETVQQQLDWACYKAGIELGEPVRMQRFTARVVEESDAARTRGLMFKPVLESDHDAKWWSLLPDGRIVCRLCPRECKLAEGQRGFCYVRQRSNDRVVLTTYGRSSGFCVDPVEKKPLNHFYPGSSVLSFGTAGCNLGCRFCQNWHISKAATFDRLTEPAGPEAIAHAAKKLGCTAVAFTYNDPVIFAEYAIDVAQACHEMGIKTIAVTAGYINPEPRSDFFRHMDAANVDLKGFDDAFYRKLCFGRLAPVQDTLKYLRHNTNVWTEVTSLLIPGENDGEKELHRAAAWFAENLGPDVPWHFTAFHPDFRMLDKSPTPLSTLVKARNIARSNGIHHVYTGNVNYRAGSTTRCSECGTELIVRDGYRIANWNLISGACPRCGTALAGRFDSQPGPGDGRRIPVRLT